MVNDTRSHTAGIWQRHAALPLAGGLRLRRMAYLPWINLLPEEACDWNYAQHLD